MPDTLLFAIFKNNLFKNSQEYTKVKTNVTSPHTPITALQLPTLCHISSV